MCLAVPGKLISVTGDDLLTRTGKVVFSGIVKEASLAFLPEATVGDYVLAHAGFAIARLNEVATGRSIAALESLGAVTDPPDRQA